MSMDLDGAVSFQPGAQSAATILCCNCGAPIDGTSAAGALCYDCIKLTVDISGGIQREATLHVCRDCDRWMSPPNQWLVAAPESRELLALCLRKLRGLNKVRIIDASFIWTEPHSRRVKVKITIQQEAFQGTILQQTFEVEYVVANQQCPDCAKSYTHNTWRACVQVRQKVPHKRTFLYLEQLILKHSAHRDTINIKETHEGIDFFFAARNSAEKFVDFLKSVVPVNSKKSQELISMDVHTSVKSYKFSFSVEIVPICKDDLVVLPIKMAKQLGNIAPLTLCNRVGTAIQVMDVQTLQTADISPDVYWRVPFTPLADVTELAEFIVLDIQPLGQTKGRYLLAEAEVARASDMGVNDKTYFCRTHLGGLLHPGDSVLGYHLEGTNFNNTLYDELENSKYKSTIPDVVLVKKHYERKKKNKRNWKVKRMAKEESEMLPRKQDQERLERDFEMFLRDVEEDADYRAGVALYKSQHAPQRGDAEEMDEDESEAGDEDQGLQIPMDQLLDEMEDLTMADGEEV
ncbi:uncharacterized protein K452DRAFT_254544 [Aplosporella prunicola CBS 121167]|uniref:60S ribosomal export protein NMD3 n=1 Tax=Aplosporella prunicola CBS 121167 TaxID=1176127 RepID=A0A6A6B5H9_9PEZI|nr:uncharacterized protein K452DRAFT_254544 [Aplosporella prunicola CBS 121167]KAF2139280.1 hypothetical protein K452DRAFT_254544 [Aplosporella prunicola CBS 121167]